MSVNVTQFKPTFDERQGKGFVDYAQRFEITPALLTAGAFKIPVTPGQIVIGVRAQVLTAWDGSATVNIGDAADADGYIPTANLAAGTVDAFYSSPGGAGAYAQGKAYMSGGVVTVAIGGTPTVGKLAVSVIYDGYGEGEDPRREHKHL
jgi:hypothetical protein